MLKIGAAMEPEGRPFAGLALDGFNPDADAGEGTGEGEMGLASTSPSDFSTNAVPPPSLLNNNTELPSSCTPLTSPASLGCSDKS